MMTDLICVQLLGCKDGLFVPHSCSSMANWLWSSRMAADISDMKYWHKGPQWDRSGVGRCEAFSSLIMAAFHRLAAVNDGLSWTWMCPVGQGESGGDIWASDYWPLHMLGTLEICCYAQIMYNNMQCSYSQNYCVIFWGHIKRFLLYNKTLEEQTDHS